MPKRLAIVINPASGQDAPILGTMNAVFSAADVDWDVFVTKKAGDARRHAQAALDAGYDAVGVYGGDGTVGEVAGALLGSETPLAIFPGGTANVMSFELGIPSDTAEALALAFDEAAAVRQIDVGELGDRHFLLRVGIGFEADMVEGADRQLKDRFGPLAYALSAVQALREPPLSHYRITLDGREVAFDGMTCIIANSGSLGRSGLSLAPNISVSDGLLDVVVVTQAHLKGLLTVAASVIAGSDDAEPLERWQAREITVAASPVQAVTVDGEIVEAPFVTVKTLPGALRVIVPATAARNVR